MKKLHTLTMEDSIIEKAEKHQNMFRRTVPHVADGGPQVNQMNKTQVSFIREEVDGSIEPPSIIDKQHNSFLTVQNQAFQNNSRNQDQINLISLYSERMKTN